MRAKDKVKFFYVDKLGIKREKVMILSDYVLTEREMSDEDVQARLTLELMRLPIDVLRREGIIFAARNLLKSCKDAEKIDVKPVVEQSGKSSDAGGAIILLLIIAFIIATIVFPLLVMLGMRGKLFLKDAYAKCKGEKYKKFVKNYTFVGIGLYAVVLIMVLVDKICELNMLVGPAFSVLFFGGIAYFVASVIIVKKQFLPEGSKICFAKMLKKKFKKGSTEEEEELESNEESETVSESEEAEEPTVVEEPVKAEEPTVVEEPEKAEEPTVVAEPEKAEEPVTVEVPEVVIEPEIFTETASEKKKEVSLNSRTNATYTEPVEEKPSVPTSKPNYAKILTVLLIGIIVILVTFAVLFMIKKSDKFFGGKDINIESTEGKEEKININDYVGYWNIKGNQEKELTIHKVDSDSVYFSLWYYGEDGIYDVSAQIKDNAAFFSLAIEGTLIKGELTFEEGAIYVEITESSRTYMPEEIMKFTEQHSKAWEFGEEEYEEEYEEESTSSDFILPNSSEEYLTEDDLFFLSPEDLKIARNEIYARHGRMFKDEEIQAYFDSKDWYEGFIEPNDFTESMLSEIERANVDLIRSFEE